MGLKLQSEGVMLVISSPSGCGKTTVSDLIVRNSCNNVIRSISVTTRPPREGEVNGKDYFFLSDEEFLKLCESGKMLEHARVFGHYYGIPRSFVEENMRLGRNILFVVDWQGAFKLKELMEESVVSVFIMPPSMDELRRRLCTRSGEGNDVEYRLNNAAFEISHCYGYDYVIVNEDPEDTASRIGHILCAEGMKSFRQRDLRRVVEASFS